MNAYNAMSMVGEISTQLRGVSYDKGDVRMQPAAGMVPLLRANNIVDDALTFADLVYVPTSYVSEKQMLQLHDVIIAASSGSLTAVGKSGTLCDADFQGTFGAFCKVLRPDPARVDPRYFSHFFRTPAYRQTVSSLAAGANINNLKNEHLDTLPIRLPLLNEQRRIAAILDKADALREKRKRVVASLDGLTQSIFLEMFGDPEFNPMKWPQLALGDVIIDGPTNGLYRPASDYGSGTPIVRIDAFYDGVITGLSSLKRLRIDAKTQSTFALNPGDIVINRVNSLEYLGKSAIVPSLAEPTVFESNMMRIRIDRARITPGFFVALLQMGAIKKQIAQAAKKAVNQASINQTDVKSFSIFLPPVDKQRDFDAAVGRINDLRVRIEPTKLDDLFSSLQQRAFSGQL